MMMMMMRNTLLVQTAMCLAHTSQLQVWKHFGQYFKPSFKRFCHALSIMRQRQHGSVWDLMHRPSKMNVYTYQTHLESAWFRGEAGLEKNLNLPKWIFGSVPTFAFKMMMVFLFFYFFTFCWGGRWGHLNWRERQNKLVTVGQHGYVGPICLNTTTKYLYCSMDTCSTFYTSAWCLALSGKHASRQFRNVIFFFILSFSLSFLLNLWMCLTEALDLLRGFLALHFGSMLKCQPRNAVRIGKYEFGATKLYKK